MKFGVGYAYWSNMWSCDYEEVIKKVSEIGLDSLEVSADHLYHMDGDYIKKLKDLSFQKNIELVINSGPSKEYDLASTSLSTRENGIKYFETIFDKMILLGSNKIAGAIYSYWPTDFATIDKKTAWDNSIESLKILAKKAEELNIYISLEILNRNETYILNDCKEGLEYINKIGSKNVNILLDTYHMNIEEDNMFEAILMCNKNLGHFHVGENNRKLPGMNNSINWAKIGESLRKINYDKTVIMEPFLLDGGEVGRDVRVFRDLSNNASLEQLDEYIKQSLNFLRDNLENQHV